jgi:hypothetical protein
MRRIVVLAAALLLVAVAAHAMPRPNAGGVNIAWGPRCFPENPVNVVAFACNSNTEPVEWPMTMSFAVDLEMTDFIGVEITLHGAPTTSVLPDWWNLHGVPEPIGCHWDGFGGYDVNHLAALADGTCHDWTAGQAFTVNGVNVYTDFLEILVVGAVDAEHPVDLQPNVEYYAGTVTIRNGRTVGTGACAGCSTGMVWTLYQLTACGLNGRRDDIWQPRPGGSACLGWNVDGLTGPYSWGFCYPVPVRNTTWGQVKALYR